MTDGRNRKPKGTETPGKSPIGVTLPRIDATPEEIAKALFQSKPEGETDKPA